MKERILGIAYEEAFWRSLFRLRRQREGLKAWSRYGREMELANFDVGAFLDAERAAGRVPRVLDVGCGASFSTGNLHRGQPMDLHFVDPLATAYNRILDRWGEGYFPHVEYGAVEHLSAFFPEGDVALIHIQNALDHSEAPMKGIVECLRALRVGGVLYLKHFPNEAETENYRGFHQFNVDEQQGQLVIWNPSCRYVVDEELASCATVELSRSDIGEVVAVVRKTAPVPAALYDDAADRALLCRRQMEAIDDFDDFGFALRYHLHSAFYRVAQVAMRLVPRDAKARLKQWLRRLRS